MFRTKKYKINGASVTLTDDYFTNPFRRKKVFNAIKQGIEKFEFLTDLGNVQIHIVKEYKPSFHDAVNSGNTAAYVSMNDINAGIHKVYFNGRVFENFDNGGEMTLDKIEETVSHELFHIYHERRNKAASKRITIPSRLLNSLEKMKIYADDKDKGMDALIGVRKVLMTFPHILYTEGLADFAKERSASEINVQKFKQMYADSLERGVSIKKSFDAMAEVIDFFEKNNSDQFSQFFKPLSKFNGIIQGHAYKIGHHMAYSILFLDSTTSLDKLASIGHINFIKKYEELMLLKGYSPVVSFRRGKGIFDYNLALEQLNRLYVLISSKYKLKR